MEFLRNLYAGLAEAWQQLSVSARINIVLAGVAAVAFIAFVVYTNSRPQFVTLSRGVEPAEMTQIVDTLEAQGVAYRVTDNNTTVMVPAAQRSDLQLVLAENNLPVGRTTDPGFELFAQTDVTSNQFQQNITYQRAIQGELQMLLNNLDFVEFSNVLIREAKDELFASEQRPSEAAVTLQVTRMPSDREAKAVVNMIARAGGPNLSQQNVTIITTDGQVIHDPGDDAFASMANSKLEYIAELERMREQRLEQSLQQMGKRGIVRVSAQVDFDEKEVEETVTSEGTELSTYVRELSTTTTERPPEGAPGALANIPEGLAQDGGTVSSETENEEIINYEPSQTRTMTTSRPGDVIKYAVTMIVEGDYETTEDADAQRTYLGLSDDDRALFTDLARAGVGEAREATEVSIHDFPFEIEGLPGAAATVAQMQAAETRAFYTQTALYAAQLLGIIVLFWFARRFLRQTVEIPEEEAEPEPIPEEKPEPESVRRQHVQAEVERLAEEEAELMSNLLRTLMTQQED